MVVRRSLRAVMTSLPSLIFEFSGRATA